MIPQFHYHCVVAVDKAVKFKLLRTIWSGTQELKDGSLTDVEAVQNPSYIHIYRHDLSTRATKHKQKGRLLCHFRRHHIHTTKINRAFQIHNNEITLLQIN